MQVPRIICKLEGGEVVDFGRLVVVTFPNGIKAAVSEKTANRRGLEWEVPCSGVPQFITDFSLVVEPSDQCILQDEYRVFKRDDLMELGIHLANRNHYVRIEHRQRFLKQWIDGDSEPAKTLDVFFSGLAKEEIEHARLE